MLTLPPPIFHLLVPDLWAYPDLCNPTIRLPFLEKILARSRAETWTLAHEQASLLHLFDLPTEKPPIAAWTYAYDGGIPEMAHQWLRADPVYLRADRDKVLLFDAETVLSLTQVEADAFIQHLNQYYAADGLQFFAPTPYRWYLAAPPDVQVQTTALHEVRGRAIHDAMPTGENYRYWRKLLNEIQMLLHAHSVNEARELRGDLPVNSVWFWGEGMLPPAPATTRWQQVWSDMPLAGGLARWAGVQFMQLTQVETILAQCHAGNSLIVLPHYVQDTGSRDEWLMQLERDWFAPLYQAVRGGKVAEIHVYVMGHSIFHLTRPDARRWWRWARAFWACKDLS